MNFTALRTMVAGFLTDACTVRSPGEPTYDEDQGIDVLGTGDVVHEALPCRLRPTGGERVVVVGDGVVTLRMFDLTCAWDVTGFAVNQIVTMDDSSDPHVIGRPFRVVDVQGGTDSPYRRLIVEDVLTVDEGEGVGT